MIQLSDFFKYKNNSYYFLKCILVLKNSIVYQNQKKERKNKRLQSLAQLLGCENKPEARVQVGKRGLPQAK